MLNQMQQDELFLPEIRQNLRLIRSSADEVGSPRWLIFDSTNNKYYTISSLAVELMNAWQTGVSSEEFLATNNQINVEKEELKAFCEFLNMNGLTVNKDSKAVEKLNERYKASKLSAGKWLIHNYLFIKLPLIRPDAFLNQTFPYVQLFFRPELRWIIFFLGGLGLLLTFRQWDSFVNSFSYFWSWEGLIFYLVTLVIIKILHELGHAYVAKKYKCRVSSMGLAFMVMFPFLYTDTTDSWKLQSRYQRLDIVTAGVRVELYIAMLATFVWSFLPDGILRSAVFILATTTWVSSLLINISPFLRFDGYYAFSDWLGIENLQSRSFAFGRWYLRKSLFGLDLEAPEPLPFRLQKTLIYYAWLTWIYRFFLFLGIALLVYYFAFKVLGIILFVVEILWFILIPVYKEIAVWWQMKDKIKANVRTVSTVSVITFLIVFLIFPWQKNVSLDAVYKSSQYVSLYSPEPAKITEIAVNAGQEVEDGDLLLELSSETLAYKIQTAKLKIQAVQAKLDRVASFADDRHQQAIYQEALKEELESLAGYEKRQKYLTIKAPSDGVISDMQRLNIGQSVGTAEPLLSFFSPDKIAVIAYLPEYLVKAIQVGAKAQFIANSGDKLPSELTVVSIEQMGIQQLNYEVLSSIHGGGIGSRETPEGRLITETPYFEVKLQADLMPDNLWIQQMAGKAIIEGSPRSWFSIFWDKVLSVLVRESGF